MQFQQGTRRAYQDHTTHSTRHDTFRGRLLDNKTEVCLYQMHVSFTQERLSYSQSLVYSENSRLLSWQKNVCVFNKFISVCEGRSSEYEVKCNQCVFSGY